MKNPLSTDQKLAIAIEALEFYARQGDNLGAVTDKIARDALRVIKEGYAVGGLVTSNQTYLVGEHSNPFPAILIQKIMDKQ